MTETAELNYYTILTNQGIQYEQECLNSSSAFHITHLAVGDGNGREVTPSKTQTKLVHEVARYPISKEEVSLKNGLYYSIAEIPYSAGNFTIREIGGYNADGKLVAVANFPPTNKQVQEEWDIHKIYVRMDLCRINEKTFPSVVNNNMAFVSGEDFQNEITNIKQDIDYTKHALKGYEDAGELLTDAEGLSDITKYAHSTFDLSKFTVVGSPNITDDGIASGFSSGNYIKASITTVSSTSTFEIKIKFKFSEIPSTWTKIWGIGSGGYSQVYITSGGITFNWAVNGTNYNSVISHLFTGTEDVTYTFGWNGTQVYSRANINGLDHTGSSANLATSMSFSEIYFANVGTTGAAFTGQIDLKQFSITVDGVEVFSGNKTGIDTIKPDDYTVVGTPTISADGVASGLNNSSNKINQLIDVSGFYNHNLRFTSRGIVQKGKRTIFFNFAPTYNDTTLCLYCETNAFILNGQYLKTDDTNAVIWCSTGSPIYFNLMTDDNPHWCTATAEFNVSTNTYTITLTREDDGQSISVSRTITDAKDNNASPRYFNGLTTATVYIGNNHWTDESDTIDLNAFKIYVDGNLVYQPCLKMPYTKGSEQYGGKYVNAQYLDRVKDAYEQGLANDYFTLDEVNGTYTLPMGNPYGMIEKLIQLLKNEIGLPKATLSNTLNDNEIWLEGAEVSKLTYSKLYAIYGDDYGTPTDSANFVLPDCRDRVMQGIGSGGTFGYIEAGLPNIKGKQNKVRRDGDPNNNGALHSSHTRTGISSGTGGGQAADIYFDASWSNPIYGNSTTVQSPAIKVRVKTRFQ